MKPVLIQHLIKNKKKGTTPKNIDEDLIVDTATPLAKFIFWGLAAIIILSVIIA